MSPIKGILILTTFEAIKLYNNVCHKSPKTHESAFLPEKEIQAELEPLLKKSGLRKDILLTQGLSFGSACAEGTNISPIGGATIHIAPFLYSTDKNACSWIIKHELCHIKKNDSITYPLMKSLCLLAAFVFGQKYLSKLSAYRLALAITIVSFILFSKRQEAKADDFAIENSSEDELKGGRRFLIACQEIGKEEDTFLKRIFGESLDFSHPSLTSRIHKIEAALTVRKIEFNEEKERHLIDYTLKPFIVNYNNLLTAEKERIGIFTVVKKILFS